MAFPRLSAAGPYYNVPVDQLGVVQNRNWDLISSQHRERYSNINGSGVFTDGMVGWAGGRLAPGCWLVNEMSGEL